MERSTTYGCHFIHQRLSSSILRIDPPELPTHARWWIQQTVRGRDFFPKLSGCFKFSSFTELVQRLMTCWLLFRPFEIFEGWVGLFLCGRTPCAITTPDMSIWNVSRVLTVYQTLLSLLVLQHFAFSTCWEFELDNSRYFLMNYNKLESSSAGVSRFGAGAFGILYLVGLHLQFLFPGGWLFPLHVECGTTNT